MSQKIAIRCLNVIIMVILGKELLNNSKKVEVLLAFRKGIDFADQNMQHSKDVSM